MAVDGFAERSAGQFRQDVLKFGVLLRRLAGRPASRPARPCASGPVPGHRQVDDRQPRGSKPDAWETGAKDSRNAPTGAIIAVRARFDRKGSCV